MSSGVTCMQGLVIISCFACNDESVEMRVCGRFKDVSYVEYWQHTTKI